MLSVRACDAFTEIGCIIVRNELSYHSTGHLEWRCKLMRTSVNGHLSSHEQLQGVPSTKGEMFPSLQGMLMLLQLGELTVGVATNQETPRLDS